MAGDRASSVPPRPAKEPGPAVTAPVTSGHASIDRFRLRVIAGPDSGVAFTSTRDHAVIGTHESADLVLHDRTVSRFHCDIVLAAGRAIVRDLDSRNGTTIDQVSVLKAHLAQGAVLGLGKTQLRFEIGPDKLQIPLSDRDRFGVMVGQSVAMRAAFALLERAAATDATVLLEGETGTGKEAAAESIHREGSRRDGPFVVVDCGAIPPDLLESELFGHEKGAFTGAHGPREGAFEAATGGTIFLDEVGELGPKLQPKLLRALERREVKRVGSNRYVPVDVRVIAATNRTLRTEVNAQRFRSDLFYRLAVIEIRLPPLRERTEDLAGLARHILESLGAAARPEASALLEPDFLAELGRHSWPGNVRELRNYLERSLALHDPTPPLPEPLSAEVGAGPIEVDPTQPLRSAREKWLGVFERRYLEALLAKNDGNVTAAARDAGVNRIHFYRLLWRHGLK
ncbi:MAG: sigma 54-dependent Fis family transcriptional regulator [Deltaproteobacteria bacterium]|nr:sigma 54-dependent Fis family transcriptional regulator [Deltaproteobacteria bacterium]